MRFPSLALPLPLALGLAACTSTPVAPIPPPLPETLAWANGAGATDGRGQAFLGLKTRENVGRSFEDLGSAAGIRVSRVVENSPAAEAGFAIGDVVLSYGEHATNDPATLEALVARDQPAAQVELQVQRGDTVFAVPVELGKQGNAPAAEPEVVHRLDPSRSRAGWVTGHAGVVLVTSDPQGPFPRAGIPLRSVVRSVDGEELFSDRALIRKLQSYPPGAKVEVQFSDPEGAARTKTVKLQSQKSRVTKAKFPVVFDYEADTAGEKKYFSVVNLWIIWLFRYERTGEEKRYSILRFIKFGSGIGELSQ